jgi:hypothetical protein
MIGIWDVYGGPGPLYTRSYKFKADPQKIGRVQNQIRWQIRCGPEAPEQ